MTAVNCNPAAAASLVIMAVFALYDVAAVVAPGGVTDGKLALRGIDQELDIRGVFQLADAGIVNNL